MASPLTRSEPRLASELPRTLLAVALAVLATIRAHAEPDLDAGWTAITSLDFPSAAARFDRERAGEPAPGEATYGYALALLNLQPRSDARWREAAGLLERVAASGSDDHLRAGALYWLARGAEWHGTRPDTALAERYLVTLLDRYPDDLFAELGISKLLMLRVGRATTEVARLQEILNLEGRVKTLRSSAARRSFHLAAGALCLYGRLSESEALRHLQAARTEGIAAREVLGDTLAQIAYFAHRLGHRELAESTMQEFAEGFPRDPRNSYLRHLRESSR